MRTIALISGLWLVLGALSSCAPPPRPAELNIIADQMKDPSAVAQAQKAAPAIFQVSQRYYKLAEDAYREKNPDGCLHYSLLAAAKFSTALEHSRRLQADDRKVKAQQRQAAAEQALAKQTARQADAESRIVRMEQIQALQHKLEEEKARSASEKAKVAAELEKAKAQAGVEAKAAAERLAAEQARVELANQEKEAQQAIAAAASKIQMAESLDAAEFDPDNLGIAKHLMELAGKSLAEKQPQQARDHAKNAEGKAAAAITKSQAQYAQKKEQIKVLEQRKALFTDASGIETDVKQDQRGVVVSLYDMFAPGKNLVLPEQTALLDRIAELAVKYPDYPLVIEGYTDATGRDVDNLALSQGRAQAVLDYLVQQKKLDFNRAKASGYGSSNPVADNSSAAGRAKNRRVEVIFLFR